MCASQLFLSRRTGEGVLFRRLPQREGADRELCLRPRRVHRKEIALSRDEGVLAIRCSARFITISERGQSC